MPQYRVMMLLPSHTSYAYGRGKTVSKPNPIGEGKKHPTQLAAIREYLEWAGYKGVEGWQEQTVMNVWKKEKRTKGRMIGMYES